jgi:elongation factor P--(R)-beta-lysine ligase
MRRRYQFELIQIIRNFFLREGFLDVMTPVAVENPGMETHIHPFQLHSLINNQLKPLYLHTSPEFCMKELLASDEGFDNIFTINYCFRDEPNSPIHRNQFLMLEWYRKHERYETIMKDLERLIFYVLEEGKKRALPSRNHPTDLKLTTMTIQEFILQESGVDILNYLDIEKIKILLQQFPEIPLPATDCDWDDYYFLFFLNIIEPKMKKYPLLLLKEFPSPLSALSTIKESDPRVCERFELYSYGVELCNCFNELINLSEQKLRFEQMKLDKERLYQYSLQEPYRFYRSLEIGLPPSSGIALGVERLLLTLFEVPEPFYD